MTATPMSSKTSSEQKQQSRVRFSQSNAMALPSAFRERLEHMEHTRNQRLSILQAEKQLQASKYLILSSKLTNIRFMEQKCFVLEQEIAIRNFKISALKSEFDRLDAEHSSVSQQLRDLRGELEEMEAKEKETETFYRTKASEMEEFRRLVEKFVAEIQTQVIQLRNGAEELKSKFTKLQGNNGVLSNSEIASAEITKSELTAAKEKLEKDVASNYQLRSQLQSQLQKNLGCQNGRIVLK